MSDIKSIGHQSIHSMQSAAAEGSQKNSEIVKEYKPAEFSPLSDEQKESIKLTRNAENKMAESAIMSGITRGLEENNKGSDKSLSSAARSDTVKNEPSKEFVKAGVPQDDIVKSPKEFLPIQTGPAGDFPGQDDLKKVAKVIDKVITGADMTQGKLDGEELGVPIFNEEKVKQAEKFFPSIPLPANPILDGEDEREEEGLGLSVVATEPPSIKSGDE